MGSAKQEEKADTLRGTTRAGSNGIRQIRLVDASVELAAVAFRIVSLG